MVATLAEFGAKLERITSPATQRSILNAAGKAGKEAALTAATRDLGGDRAMSNFKRRVPLGAGYDPAGSSAVVINFRPAGLWRLASQGRRSSGPIMPKTKRAVLTPGGPRASSSYGSSRGLDTFDDAVTVARREVPQAAAKAFTSVIASMF